MQRPLESFTVRILRESEYRIQFEHNGEQYQVRRSDCDRVAYHPDDRAVLTMSQEVYESLVKLKEALS